MHLVILVALVVTVYGRDLPDAGYSGHPHHEPYGRWYLNSPPPEANERRNEEFDPNTGIFEDDRPFHSNNRGQLVNNEHSRAFRIDRVEKRHHHVRKEEKTMPFPFHHHENSPLLEINERRYKEYDPNRSFEDRRFFYTNNRGQNVNNEDNREFSNGRNERGHHLANEDQRGNHGVIRDVNPSFENPGRYSITNLKRQSFSENNGYSDSDPPTGGEGGDMVFKNDDGHNTNNSPDKNVPKTGIMTFFNNVNNNTNLDMNSNERIKPRLNKRNDHNTKALKSDITLSKPSKTTIENEVTTNPFHSSPIEKGNNTSDEDKWIWDDGGKTETDIATTEATTPLFVDRGAFIINHCSSDKKRVQGMCVYPDLDSETLKTKKTRA